MRIQTRQQFSSWFFSSSFPKTRNWTQGFSTEITTAAANSVEPSRKKMLMTVTVWVLFLMVIHEEQPASAYFFAVFIASGVYQIGDE
jgi:hypothetical protein